MKEAKKEKEKVSEEREVENWRKRGGLEGWQEEPSKRMGPLEPQVGDPS